jgi:hypothetical protein
VGSGQGHLIEDSYISVTTDSAVKGNDTGISIRAQQHHQEQT